MNKLLIFLLSLFAVSLEAATITNWGAQLPTAAPASGDVILMQKGGVTYYFTPNQLATSLSTNVVILNSTSNALYLVIASAPLNSVLINSNGTIRGRSSLATPGTNNLGLGSTLGSLTSGTFNTALGTDAIRDVVSGSENTAVGYQSMLANRSGHRNAALGMYSLFQSTNGLDNTALGYKAMFSSLSGYSFTAVGINAASAGITINRGVAVGDTAYAFNTNGSFDVAIGDSAMQNTLTGERNTGVGHAALMGADNTFSWGSRNTAVGDTALSYVGAASNNTAVGVSSLLNGSNLVFCTAIGAYSGSGILSGNEFSERDVEMTFLGAYASRNAANPQTAPLTNSTSIGYGAQVTKSHQIVVGDTRITETLLRSNVGINTDTPQMELDVRSVAVDPANDNVARLTSSGRAFALLYTEDNNYGSHWQFGNTAGLRADVGFEAFYQVFNISASYPIVFEAGGRGLASSTPSFEKMRIATNGLVGIGTNAPSARLHVTGAAAGSLVAQFGTIANNAIVAITTNGLAIGSATAAVLTNTLYASATLDFPSTVAGTVSDLPITVTGASDGDIVSIGVPSGSIGPLAGGVFQGWSSNGVCYVRFANNALAAAMDPASGTFKIRVDKFQ